MPVCFVKNCKNSSRKRIPGVTFHRVPTRYKLEWLSAINRSADTFVINQRICSDHFAEKDFYSFGERKRLKDEAIPSIRTMHSIDETCIKSESVDPLIDTDSTQLPEQQNAMEKPREEAIAFKSRTNSTNNSIDKALTLKKGDFGTICRCCLSHETIANIFYLKFGETLFVDIFFKLLGTQVSSSDGLPKHICAACVAALINFYNFQKKYNNSLATLLSVSGANQDYNIQHMGDDAVNDNIKEEMPDVNISENELDEESQNENNDRETQKLDDPNEESCMATNESFTIPQLEDDTENKQFENSDTNISEDELDEEFQYESYEKENINGVENNTTNSLSPEKQKQYLKFPRFCKFCKAWIIHKDHKCPKSSSHVCEICGKNFLQNATLQVHYRVHKLSLLVKQISDEKGVANPITDATIKKRMNLCSCGETFTLSKDLARHKTETNHLDPLEKKCEICNKVVTRRGFYRHMRNVHSPREKADLKLECSTCGKVFKTKPCLVQHSKLHGEKNCLCAYCGKRFHDTAGFKRHCLSHSGEKPFSCNVCGRKFGNSRNLQRHMYVHTGEKPYVCKFCSKAFRQLPHLRAHLRTHTGEKPYKCPYCDKTFAYDATRVTHIRLHTGEKPYICDICGDRFNQRGSMVIHRRSHTGEKPYLCDHCGATFSTRSAYNTHLHAKHQQKEKSLGDPGVQCKICDKFYSSKQALKTHMYIHGEKKNLCTYCGKRFYTKAALEGHSRVHTGEKKFSCNLCDKKFRYLITYKQHQYIHTGKKPYTCKICSKDFRQSAHLVSHMRTHTGEKPYGCPYCDKTFAHFTTRIVHVRTHTGERPYVCDVCSKGFCHSSAMTKHRQRHFKKVSSESADCEATD